MTARPLIIFGAGRTGRGFLAHVAARAGREFVLVDRDAGVIAQLRAAGSYDVEVLSSPPRRVELSSAAAYELDAVEAGTPPWQRDFDAADICFTAVFGDNLPGLGRSIAKALAARYGRKDAAVSPLQVVTCENLKDAACTLKESVVKSLPSDARLRATVDRNVGFVEAMVLKTCIGPAHGDSPLTVRAEDFFDLPCDATAFRGSPPEDLGDLRPQPNFEHQLVRKLYTYNAINAVITYVGARRGLQFLAEAANDPIIRDAAVKAAKEASDALVAEFGFDQREQDSWVTRALAKFSNPAIPDPLARNGANPRRKLGRDDRLVGPARLALKHGIEPRALACAIFAAMEFASRGEPPLSADRSFEQILSEVCGLEREEPLALYLRRLRRDAGADAPGDRSC